MRTTLSPVILALAVTAAFAVSGSGAATGTSPPHTIKRPTQNRAAAPAFSHVVVIVFENRGFRELYRNPNAPTFNSFRKRFAVLTSYFGVAHPSLPNYLGLVSGSTQGIKEDCTDCIVDARNLTDTLEAAGKSWKTYAEGIPSPGYTGSEFGRYAKKHNPFLYFQNVLASQSRLGRIVNFSRLSRDLRGGTLPDFALIVPDQCHNTHDCTVNTGDRWFKRFLPPLLANRQLKRGSVVFTIFDEGTKKDLAWGGGHTFALALGPTVRTRSRSAQRLDHYSLLRTIEDAWGLPQLGHSAEAEPILGIWR